MFNFFGRAIKNCESEHEIEEPKVEKKKPCPRKEVVLKADLKTLGANKKARMVQTKDLFKEKLAKLNECGKLRCKIKQKDLKKLKQCEDVTYEIPANKYIPKCGPVIPSIEELDIRIREKLEAEESIVYGYNLKKARSRRDQKYGLRQEQIEMLKPEELSSLLALYGMVTGPIESGTIFVYQKKLLQLESKGDRKWRLKCPQEFVLNRKKKEKIVEPPIIDCSKCKEVDTNTWDGSALKKVKDTLEGPVRRIGGHALKDCFGVPRNEALPYLPRCMGGGFYRQCETDEKDKYGAPLNRANLPPNTEILVFTICVAMVIFVIFNGEPLLYSMRSHFSKKPTKVPFFND